MRTLVRFAVLLSIAAPALAQVRDAIALPEPGILSLIGIGAAAILATWRRK